MQSVQSVQSGTIIVEQTGDNDGSESSQAAQNPSGQPIPEGGADRGEGQSESPRESEGQVEYRWPTFDEVVGILYELASELFGSADHPYPAFHIDDIGLLESALALPHQPYYETFEEGLAAMTRSVAANHALRDGNKRLAVTILHSTLLVNRRVYIWSDDDAVAVAIRCASGDTDFHWLADFIGAWASPIGHDEVFVSFDTPDGLHAAISAIREAHQQRLELADAGQATLHELISAHAGGTLNADGLAYVKQTFG